MNIFNKVKCIASHLLNKSTCFFKICIFQLGTIFAPKKFSQDATFISVGDVKSLWFLKKCIVRCQSYWRRRFTKEQRNFYIIF
jgi:hypothetical protein